MSSDTLLNLNIKPCKILSGDPILTSSDASLPNMDRNKNRYLTKIGQDWLADMMLSLKSTIKARLLGFSSLDALLRPGSLEEAVHAHIMWCKNDKYAFYVYMRQNIRRKERLKNTATANIGRSIAAYTHCIATSQPCRIARDICSTSNSTDDTESSIRS